MTDWLYARFVVLSSYCCSDVLLTANQPRLLRSDVCLLPFLRVEPEWISAFLNSLGRENLQKTALIITVYAPSHMKRTQGLLCLCSCFICPRWSTLWLTPDLMKKSNLISQHTVYWSMSDVLTLDRSSFMCSGDFCTSLWTRALIEVEQITAFNLAGGVSWLLGMCNCPFWIYIVEHFIPWGKEMIESLVEAHDDTTERDD